MKILIAGDSFAADRSDQNREYPAWWQLMPEHDVINIAQPGCSEYKILQQIVNHPIEKYDCVIVCHTSPYRVHCQTNPFHPEGVYHNSDLIYNDVKASPNSAEKDHVLYWFENIMDLEWARDIHGLIKERIFRILSTDSQRHCHINFFNSDDDAFILDKEINFYKIWKKHPGKVNHLSAKGNRMVADIINEVLK